MDPGEERARSNEDLGAGPAASRRLGLGAELVASSKRAMRMGREMEEGGSVPKPVIPPVVPT